VQGAENIASGDLTEISLKIAGMLANPDKTAFVFSDYAMGLAASPMASYVGAPMIYAENLDAVSEKLGEMGIIQIVTLGAVEGGSLHLATVSEINDYFVNFLAGKGEYCDYIVVANANDININHTENKFPQDCLSMAAAPLAAFRNAVIAIVDFEPGEKWENPDGVNTTKNAIMETRQILLSHGMVPNYLCLVGDTKTMPMKYYRGCGTGEYAKEGVPSDNYYGDFDGNPLTQEIAIGRIVGRHVGDASALVARSVGYDRIIEAEKAVGGVGGTGYTSWIRNVYFLEGTVQIELFDSGDVVKVAKSLTEGGFLTKFRWAAMAADPIAQQEIYNNNYLIYYGHGGEDAWGEMGVGGVDPITIDARDLEGKIIPPGNGIAASCLTSRLDAGMALDEYISLAFLHSGCLSYYGATRVSWGEVKIYPALESSCNGLLANRYIELLTRFNSTIGNALMQAKNEYYGIASNYERTLIYIDNNGVPEVAHGLTVWDIRTMLEYPLYGDPEANPYEYPATDVIFG
ncbi:MAG: C25 family cysteine peptidase, partial [Candidatus Thermoplasmatota archaeon]|nr:C25 family cysteine peptidase [Candidatus Thermoplasmatota archaeon]